MPSEETPGKSRSASAMRIVTAVTRPNRCTHRAVTETAGPNPATRARDQDQLVPVQFTPVVVRSRS